MHIVFDMPKTHSQFSTMKKKPWFKPKPFTHLTPKISFEDGAWVKNYVQDISKIASHSFYPLIHRSIATKRLKKGISKAGENTKKLYTYKDGKKVANVKYREIYYPTHLDAHIYSYYFREVLEPLYESELHKDPLLNDAVIGYRAIPIPDNSRCKANYDFANEVFEAIRASQGEIAVIALDISKFFDSIDHKILKKAWVKLLGNGFTDLPKHHYNVYKSLTRFSYVELNSLLPILNLNHPNQIIQKEVAHFASTGKEFREKIKHQGLIKENPFRRIDEEKKIVVGIPQGTPISPLLANLYLLDFDRQILDLLPTDSLYRRYSDDILVICKKEAYKDIEEVIYDLIKKEFKLIIQPSKTQRSFFNNGKLSKGEKPIGYLGFQFDGHNKLLKPASVAKFYRKLKRNVKYRASMARRAKKKSRRGLKVDCTLHRKILYQQFTFIGGNRKSGKKRNFFSYAYMAAKVMNSPHIKKQLARAWQILHSEIDKYENRFRLPKLNKKNR
jgi:hypothetical protein